MKMWIKYSSLENDKKYLNNKEPKLGTSLVMKAQNGHNKIIFIEVTLKDNVLLIEYRA